MHDSFLLHKIAAALQRICDDNHLGKIREVMIEVSYDSHIDSKELHEHLVEIIPKLVDSCTIVTIKKADMEEQTAMIYMLKGDSVET